MKLWKLSIEVKAEKLFSTRETGNGYWVKAVRCRRNGGGEREKVKYAHEEIQ